MTISNGGPKCNGSSGYPHSLHFLPSPDAELSTCSSKDTAWSEVSSEGSSTVSDEPPCSGSASYAAAAAGGISSLPYTGLCNGHLSRHQHTHAQPTRSKAEKRSFKRRRSKQAEQLLAHQQQGQQRHSWNGYGDEENLLPVSIPVSAGALPTLEELIKGKQELGVGMGVGSFRVQTVTGHV